MEGVTISLSASSEILSKGEVDAVISFDPIAYQLQKQGYINLLDSRILSGQIVDVLITRDIALQQQRKNLQLLLEGYWKVRNYIADYPVDAVNRIASRLGVTSEKLVLLFENLVLPEIEHRQTIFNQQLESIIEQMNRLMIETGLLKNAIDSKPLLVHDFLD